MRGDEPQPTLSSTAAWLKSLTSTVVQNATDSTDRRVFSDCCCERRGLVDQSATRASGGAIATPAHRACARTHSQSPATDGRYGFLSLGAAHRVASADESLLAKACVRSTSSEAASRSALAVLEVCSSGGRSVQKLGPRLRGPPVIPDYAPRCEPKSAARHKTKLLSALSFLVGRAFAHYEGQHLRPPHSSRGVTRRSPEARFSSRAPPGGASGTT